MPVTPAPRPRKTPGDYFAIALAPALIVVLVGSLTFFLVEVLYHGSQGGRLRWTLAWFTAASVLITRIAIELGSSRGFVYGFALGGVTSLALIRYVEPPFAGIALLAVSWFCVDRLVRDCTLIDDDEDATGEGLLDQAGLGEKRPPTPTERVPGRLLYVEHATREAKAAMTQQDGAPPRKTARPPGVWVVGFSLAALPLFGLGQVFVPATDPWKREIVFTCLWFYLLSAFGLLLTTSFLGLRRYLRQRRVPMPATIAVSWLSRGALIAVGVLLISLLLPRPDAAYSLSALAERVGAQPAASEVAASAGKPGTGPGQPGQESGAREDGRGSTQHSGPEKEPSGQGTDSTATAKNAASRTASTDRQPDSTRPTPARAPNVPSGLGQVLKWLVYAVLALGVLLLLVRHGAALWAGLVELWRDLWSLGRRKPSVVEVSSVSKTKRSTLPFSAFRNPFHDPKLSRLSAGELVTYSFDALQAWAAGFGLPRGEEETPLEFARRLSESVPDFAGPIHATVLTYSRVAYADQPPDPESLTAVRQLWALLSGSSQSS